jgi:dephospho-CoA kinase
MAEIAGDAPYVIYEAPLIVEHGLHHGMAALVVVAVDDETQLGRLMKRDDFNERDAKARIAAQLPLRDKIAAADYVIETNGPLEVTRKKVRDVHEALLSRFGGGRDE